MCVISKALSLESKSNTIFILHIIIMAWITPVQYKFVWYLYIYTPYGTSILGDNIKENRSFTIIERTFCPCQTPNMTRLSTPLESTVLFYPYLSVMYSKVVTQAHFVVLPWCATPRALNTDVCKYAHTLFCFISNTQRCCDTSCVQMAFLSCLLGLPSQYHSFQLV